MPGRFLIDARLSASNAAAQILWKTTVGLAVDITAASCLAARTACAPLPGPASAIAANALTTSRRSTLRSSSASRRT
jgi:hypothetical protein